MYDSLMLTNNIKEIHRLACQARLEHAWFTDADKHHKGDRFI